MSAHDEPRTPVADPDPDATLVRSSEQQARLASAAGGVEMPGYQIEGTLGRGGMGVVYKATQTGLNRTVALKMLVGGQYADPALRARFLIEAESVAALEHPNIVRVFAFGEHDGHPYLAMEYLPGGTLAERVKEGGPLPATEAAELLAKLADAVAHAHSRGVVHRDIKPLNVLLTAEGEPRLTDFGLAKVGRADHNLSVTGQVLGTPSYMAPEQAAGKVHEVGTAADVYALGALFYDVLTGRPPFSGDSAAVTLQRVMTEEPERLRKHRPDLPRDLETICLRCLEKQPGNRYLTAQTLADDLRRYLSNEPISVRPAGPVERAYKWVRRNRLVSASAAAVFLALALGLGFSISFGMEAEQRRKEADAAAGREAKEKQDAITARNQLAAAAKNLERSNDELNGALARALLGPLALHSNLSFPLGGRFAAFEPFATPLTPYEQNALWELASRRNTPVGPRFIEEGVASPLACKQLATRAPFAAHAAIGLDATLRARVNQTLAAKIEVPGAAREQRLDLVRAGARSAALDRATAERAARPLREWVLDAPKGGTGFGVPQKDPQAVGDLLALALAMPPEAGAAFLAGVMTDTTDQLLLSSLAEALAIAAERLPPDLAATRCERAARLLADLCAPLPGASPWQSASLAGAVVRLAAQMPAGRAAVVCDAAAGALLKVQQGGPSAYDLLATAEALSALAPFMTPARRTSSCDELAQRLAAALTAMHQPGQVPLMIGKQSDLGLAGLARHMPGDRAAAACEKAASVFAKKIADAQLDPLNSAALISSFAALVRHLPPERAAECCDKPARSLAGLIAKKGPATPAPGFLNVGFGQALAEVALFLPAQESVKLLLETMPNATTPSDLGAIAGGLARASDRLPPEERRAACDQGARLCLAGMRLEAQQQYGSPSVALVNGLTALAARLSPDRAAEFCDPAGQLLVEAATKPALVEALTSPAPGFALPRGEVAVTLASLSAHMTPAKARTACEKTARVLESALNATAASDGPAPPGLSAGMGIVQDRARLAMGLGVLTARFAPEKAGHQLIDSIATVGTLPLGLGAEAPPPVRALQVELSAVTLGLSPAEYQGALHARAAAPGSFATPHNVLPSLLLLHPHLHPQPNPLPPQELVELLKHPFCVGEARRAVLDALAFTYKRSFKDQWEFVEYAQKHQPQLDLLTPPKRPQQP